jgi:dTDP-4-dehydrorhamnose reductase
VAETWSEQRSAKGSARGSGAARVLILGAGGQLGRELERSFAGFGNVAAVGRESADLARSEELRALVRRVEPDFILNAAAYTAVDRAESEPELAYAVNAEAARILAEEALAHDALMVYYSTDYVFDGSKPEPWTESDAPHPLNVYGASKLAGERAIQETGARALIFRTSWVYGPQGKNFLFTMLRLAGERDRLAIVDDQVGAPTTSVELARMTRTILDGVVCGVFGAPSEWTGLYHMSCAGAVTWFGFAQAIFARAVELRVKAPELKAITSDEYPTPAKRPRNSVLSNAKLEERFGVRLAPWQAALDEVLRALRVGED